MDNETLTYALRYAERGVRVFPVQPGGKAPFHELIDSWKDEATSDVEQIRQWFEKHPESNLGVATGEWAEETGLFVVDIDMPDGYETWKRKRADHEGNPPPETLHVRTPSGGAHLYYAAAPGVQIKSAKDTLGDCLDTKGHGGYVVAPPSTTDEGTYAFDGDVKAIAPAPRWLVSAAQKNRSTPDSEPVPSVNYDGDVDAELVEDALSAIPAQPDYDKWVRIIAAVKDGAATDGEAERMLERWSPENQHGDYTYSERLKNAPDNEITVGTLFYYAKEHGWEFPSNRTNGTTASGAPSGDGQVEGPPVNIEEHRRRKNEDEDEEEEVTLEDLDIESVPELLSSDVRPPEPLVTYEGRSLLHEGTTELVAKPKIGKTNMAMNLGLAIASERGKALGNAEVQRHGRVLMLNLDGSRRGSYDRFKTMTAEDPNGPPRRFDILHGQFPEVGEGALDLLGEYVGENPDTELIIVDTLQHLRPTSDGRRNVYHEDYDFVHPIAEFGRETDTSILLVHHLNKLQNGDELDKVSGSTGLTGAVENVMILDRARGESKATLSVRPREDREQDFELEFDGKVQTWTVGSDTYEPKSQARREIYNHLVDVGQDTLGNIAEAVDKSTDNVSKRLADMKENGAPIKKPQRGVYKVVSGAS